MMFVGSVIAHSVGENRLFWLRLWRKLNTWKCKITQWFCSAMLTLLLPNTSCPVRIWYMVDKVHLNSSLVIEALQRCPHRSRGCAQCQNRWVLKHCSLGRWYPCTLVTLHFWCSRIDRLCCYSREWEQMRGGWDLGSGLTWRVHLCYTKRQSSVRNTPHQIASLRHTSVVPGEKMFSGPSLTMFLTCRWLSLHERRTVV